MQICTCKAEEQAENLVIIIINCHPFVEQWDNDCDNRIIEILSNELLLFVATEFVLMFNQVIYECQTKPFVEKLWSHASSCVNIHIK